MSFGDFSYFPISFLDCDVLFSYVRYNCDVSPFLICFDDRHITFVRIFCVFDSHFVFKSEQSKRDHPHFWAGKKNAIISEGIDIWNNFCVVPAHLFKFWPVFVWFRNRSRWCLPIRSWCPLTLQPREMLRWVRRLLILKQELRGRFLLACIKDFLVFS